MKIAVVGAGPAGLTAAYELSKSLGRGVSALDVYEADSQVGGLAKSVRLWGVTADVGPHRFFTHNRRVNELWREVVGGEYRMVRRLTRIYYNNRFFYYPLRPFDVVGKLGLLESALSVLSYMNARLRPPEDLSNFESWVVAQFGRRLYNAFFKTYSEKLWGIACSELDSDFGAQRIKKLSLYEAIVNALGLAGKNKHKTLVSEFAYPLRGTGWVYERMAELVRERGGNIFLNTAVRRVLAADGAACGLELAGGEKRNYDAIVSTMPLSDLVLGLESVPAEAAEAAKKLRYRNTIVVFLNVASDALFPDQWIYVHAPGVKAGRISNFRNWVPTLYGDAPNTVLGLEYWCSDGDALWRMSETELIALAKAELAAAGLLKGAAVSDGCVMRLPKSYPVYFKGYKEVLKPIRAHLAGIKNLYPIGRYGAYKYNNQDHSFMMGMMCAENILCAANHDLWAVNTDYDVYQEGAADTSHS